MATISKTKAAELALDPNTASRMLVYANSNQLPEMEKQAKKMQQNRNLIITTGTVAGFLLVAVCMCEAKHDLVGRYTISLLTGVNASLFSYSVKKFYDSVCYVQNVAQNYVDLLNLLQN